MKLYYILFVLAFLYSISSKVKLKTNNIPSNDIDEETEESKRLKEQYLEEDIRDNKHLQSEVFSKEEIAKRTSYDGLVMKVDSIVFEYLMKEKENKFALIFIDEYDEKCQQQVTCKRRNKLYKKFKKASVEVASIHPPVLMLYMKCSLAPTFCNTEERQKSVPFVVWFQQNKFIYYDFSKNGIEPKDYVKFIKNELKFTYIEEVTNKYEFQEFINNSKYIRMLGVFPMDNSNSKNYENYFVETVTNSTLIKSGDFVFAKTYDTSYINYKEVDKKNPSILIFTTVPVPENIEDIKNIENYDGIDFFNRKVVELVRSYSFSSDVFDKNYDKNVFLKEVVLESLPYLTSSDNRFYRIAEEHIDHQFLLVIDPKSTKNVDILENYKDISKKFRENKILVTFSFLFYGDLIRDIVGNKVNFSNLPVLFYNNNRNAHNQHDVSSLLYNGDITYNGLEDFYQVSANHNLENKTKSKKAPIMRSEDIENEEQTSPEIHKVVFDNFNKLVVKPKNDVLVFYHEDDYNDNVLCRKWNLLLKTIKMKVNEKNFIEKLKIYRFNTARNIKTGIYMPKKLPQLVLFQASNNKTPVDYPQGPSIKLFSNFLELFIEDINLNIQKEDTDKYLTEIFNNPLYKEKNQIATDATEKVISKDFDEELFEFENRVFSENNESNNSNIDQNPNVANEANSNYNEHTDLKHSNSENIEIHSETKNKEDASTTKTEL